MAEDEKSKERELGKKERFEILLEDMNKNIKGIAEGHGILLAEVKDGNRKSEERDKELEDMMKFNSKVLHEKIDKVEARLTEKIDNVDKRLANVEQDVGILKQDVNVLKQDVKTINTKLDKVIVRQDKQEERQDKHEVKINEVYHKVFNEGAGF
jgi:septal ring factor EnvC (AmiA/AmiB activator)